MNKGWEMVRLGQIAKINMGQSPDSSTYNATGIGIPFYQGNADFGELYPKVRLYCSNPTKYANINDILMSVRAPVGAFNISKEHCCIGRGLTAITAIEDVSFFKYLYYNLKYQSKYIQSLGVGSTFMAISAKEIQNLYIPFPPISNQRQIASTLDKASELISLRKKQLEELDALAESVFYNMFGDPVKNEKRWDVNILKNFGKVSTGNTPSREEKKYYNDSYIEWIKSDNIMDENMLLSQAKEYLSEEGSLKGRIAKSGSILMTCIAGSLKSVGTVGVADRDVAFNQQINAIYPCKKVEKLYLYSMLKHSKRHIQSYASNGMKHLLNKSTLESIYFSIPPILLQTHFATIIEKTEQQKALAKKALQESEDLFQRLMQDLFKPD